MGRQKLEVCIPTSLISSGPQFLHTCSELGWVRNRIISLGLGSHRACLPSEAGGPRSLEDRVRVGRGGRLVGHRSRVGVGGGCGEVHPLSVFTEQTALPCPMARQRVAPRGLHLPSACGKFRLSPRTLAAPGAPAGGREPLTGREGKAWQGLRQHTPGLTRARREGPSWGKRLEPASMETKADSNPVHRAGSWAAAQGLGEPGNLGLQGP